MKRTYHGVYVHPLTGKPVKCTRSTRAELERIRVTWQGMRDDLAKNVITREELARRLGEPDPIPFSRVAAWYLDPPERLRPKSQTAVAKFVASSGLADRDVLKLDAAAVSQWFDRLARRGLLPSSRLTYWALLSAIVRRAVQLRQLERVPWGEWRPKVAGGRRAQPQEAARTPAELVAIFMAARDIDEERRRRSVLPVRGGPRLYQLLEPRVAVIALLGLGQGECAGLRWPDLDRARGEVAIVRQYDGQPLKTAFRRANLAAPPVLFQILDTQRAFLEERGLYDPKGPIFPRSKLATAHPFRAGAFKTAPELIKQRDWRAIMERSGLPNPERWTVRALRRSFATLETIAAGGDLSRVKARTRHGTISKLALYLESSREPARPAFELPPQYEPPALPPKEESGAAE